MGPPFPVAASAEAATHAPAGRAWREREAEAVAGGPVRFTTDWIGPVFASQEAALAAYGARAEAPGCTLRPVLGEEARPASPPARPELRDGVRWPAAPASSPARWRLSVTYWRIAAEPGEEAAVELEPARRLRRDAAAGAGLDGRTLRRLSEQPLRPVRPQQPLDTGLFEVRLPERPDVVVPDE